MSANCSEDVWRLVLQFVPELTLGYKTALINRFFSEASQRELRRRRQQELERWERNRKFYIERKLVLEQKRWMLSDEERKTLNENLVDVIVRFGDISRRQSELGHEHEDDCGQSSVLTDMRLIVELCNQGATSGRT